MSHTISPSGTLHIIYILQILYYIYYIVTQTTSLVENILGDGKPLRWYSSVGLAVGAPVPLMRKPGQVSLLLVEELGTAQWLPPSRGQRSVMRPRREGSFTGLLTPFSHFSLTHCYPF